MCDDFVLKMSENVNKQPVPKPKVIKGRKPKLSKRCPYTIDWVDESQSSSGISSNNLTISSNLLTSTDK